MGRLTILGRWGPPVNGKLERLPGDGGEEALRLYQAQNEDLCAGWAVRPSLRCNRTTWTASMGRERYLRPGSPDGENRLRQLARLAKLGRMDLARAEETPARMTELCGIWGGTLEEWVRFVETARHEKPGSRDALHPWMLVFSILQEASQPRPGSGRRKRTVEPVSMGTERPCKPADLSTWTDEAREAVIG